MTGVAAVLSAARRHKHTAMPKATRAAGGGDGHAKPCEHYGNLHICGGFRRCQHVNRVLGCVCFRLEILMKAREGKE